MRSKARTLAGLAASQRVRPPPGTTQPTMATCCRDSGAFGLDPGGRLVSVENDAGRRQEAAENLAAVRLTDAVDLVLANAEQVLTDTPTGSVDLLFLDADRSAYVDYWPELLRVLCPGGLRASTTASHTPARSPSSTRSPVQPRTSKPCSYASVPACCSRQSPTLANLHAPPQPTSKASATVAPRSPRQNPGQTRLAPLTLSPNSH